MKRNLIALRLSMHVRRLFRVLFLKYQVGFSVNNLCISPNAALIPGVSFMNKQQQFLVFYFAIQDSKGLLLCCVLFGHTSTSPNYLKTHLIPNLLCCRGIIRISGNENFILVSVGSCGSVKLKVLKHQHSCSLA